MKHHRLFLVSVVVLSLFGFTTTAKAASAACVVLTISNPPFDLVTFVALAGHSYEAIETGASSSTEFLGPFPDDTEYFPILDPNSTVQIIDLGLDCGGPVTFFNPNDGRLDPRPGDRLALYCNPASNGKPANIDVLGLINNNGVELIDPALSNIANQWQSFPDGMGGSVSIGGQGSSIAVQWFNSSVGATGTGDFTKTVTCTG